MLIHKGTREIRTERLLLRKITARDADAVYKWMSDSDVVKYEDWDVHENTDYTRGFISYLTEDYKSKNIYCWGIERNDGAFGGLIGKVFVAGVSDYSQTGALAYYLRKDCWGAGYATEAAKAVLHYMFTEVGLGRIDARHCTGNPSSGEVLKKAGMLYRGHVKDYFFCHGEWHDCDFYGLTKDKYINTVDKA